ncbi:MAG: hypothetical protein ACLSA2_11145 [Candidatus Gastranaerophilaceae bacterium]
MVRYSEDPVEYIKRIITFKSCVC